MSYRRQSPQPVVEGGTGAATLTGILTGNGTSAVTANAVTQHGVLIGGASNAASSTSVGATGTVLIGTTSSDPSFSATPTVTSITFGSGSALSTFVDKTSWTPVLSFGGGSTGITYSTQSGTYSRIGNIVIFNAVITLTNKGNSTGNAAIGGFPLTLTSNVSASISFSALTYTGQISVLTSGTTLLPFSSATTGAITQLQDTAFVNTSQLYISGIAFV